VKLAIHVSEQWDFFHLTFPYKNGIVRIKPHDGDVEIGEMIGTEDVSFVWIKFLTVLNLPGQYDNWKINPRPNAIDCTNEFEKFWKRNGN
jgi:hypothetical protein